MITEKFLNVRGYTHSYLSSINDPHREKLLNIDKMVDKLHEIKTDGSHLVIIPDFDTDGIMSGVLGFAGFSELGFNVSLHMPVTNKGYGFNETDIDNILAKYPTTKAIITCDVGTSCYDAVAHAKELGLTVLVTDHHIQSDSTGKLKADVFVNPMAYNETYEHPYICGAFVLYQVLEEYALKYGTNIDRDQIRRLQLFAGIGTISDSMPLLYENRDLVKKALNIANLIYSKGSSWIVDSLKGSNAYVSAFSGFFNTISHFSELGKVPDESIETDFLNFYLVPTLNSTKRLEVPIDDVFLSFFGLDQSTSINKLIDLNEERKLLVKSKSHELLSDYQPFAPYIYIGDIPGGVAGLIATDIMKTTKLPCCVISFRDDVYKGSGRSPEWFAFNSFAKDRGFSIEGHQHAFGCKFTTLDQVQALYDALSETIPKIFENVTESDDDGTHRYGCDLYTSLDDDNNVDFLFNIPDVVSFVYDLEDLKPFGSGFLAPKIALHLKRQGANITRLGKDDPQPHIKISKYGLDILFWNQPELYDTLCNAEDIVLSGSFSINEFKDNMSLNFVVDSVLKID